MVSSVVEANTWLNTAALVLHALMLRSSHGLLPILGNLLNRRPVQHLLVPRAEIWKLLG